MSTRSKNKNPQLKFANKELPYEKVLDLINKSFGIIGHKCCLCYIVFERVNDEWFKIYEYKPSRYISNRLYPAETVTNLKTPIDKKDLVLTMYNELRKTNVNFAYKTANAYHCVDVAFYPKEMWKNRRDDLLKDYI